MNSLAKYLVGTCVEFKSGKYVIEGSANESLQTEREAIDTICTRARSLSEKDAVVVLAEVMSYYRKQVFFPAVKGAFSLGRLRSKIVAYLDSTDIDGRQQNLISLLKKGDNNSTITAVKCFLGVYKSRVLNFKKYLTREQYRAVC
jgi:hypothetical protein